MTTGPFSGSSRPGTPSASAVVGEAPIVPSVEAQHLARFEFSDAGTKVLMVEWYSDAVPGPAASANCPADTPASTEHVGRCRGRGSLLTSLLVILSQTPVQALLLRLHLVNVVAVYSSCSPLMPRSPRRSLSRLLAHPV
ncbi:hypothetical protein LB505_003753 [Fusarium chuoi]|nr:hypothetical protein LB505_003753 [Fusarium chuoi]